MLFFIIAIDDSEITSMNFYAPENMSLAELEIHAYKILLEDKHDRVQIWRLDITPAGLHGTRLVSLKNNHPTEGD